MVSARGGGCLKIRLGMWRYNIFFVMDMCVTLGAWLLGLSLFIYRSKCSFSAMIQVICFSNLYTTCWDILSLAAKYNILNMCDPRMNWTLEIVIFIAPLPLNFGSMEIKSLNPCIKFCVPHYSSSTCMNPLAIIGLQVERGSLLCQLVLHDKIWACFW